MKWRKLWTMMKRLIYFYVGFRKLRSSVGVWIQCPYHAFQFWSTYPKSLLEVYHPVPIPRLRTVHLRSHRRP